VNSTVVRSRLLLSSTPLYVLLTYVVLLVIHSRYGRTRPYFVLCGRRSEEAAGKEEGEKAEIGN